MKWVRDNLDGYLNFYSVSGDGRVTNWTLVKNCLWHSDQLTISFARQLTNLAEPELGRCLFLSVQFLMMDHIDLHLFFVQQIICNFCWALGKKYLKIMTPSFMQGPHG